MKKILIVDDQAGWRNFHSEAIKKYSHEDVLIDTADSAENGYSKIIENVKKPYDIILSDLQMEDNYAPKLAGEWFVEQVKEQSSYYRTKVIIISASPSINLIAKDLGVEYIRKSTAVNNPECYKEILDF